MPSSSFSLLDTHTLSARDILTVFEKADRFDQLMNTHGSYKAHSDSAKTQSPRVVACLFFEPSTRTRLSFQMASYRLGHHVLTAEMNAGTSLSKGETLYDTVLNVCAMKPDALVVRYGVSDELERLLPTLSMPVISAGSGISSHPTQALLDAYTIQKAFGSVSGKKILITGDLKHSRVARSNFDVLLKLGAEIGIYGPKDFLPENEAVQGLQVFESLDDATAWCDVYMGLRIQLERHGEGEKARALALADYHSRFGLSQSRLKILKKDAIIMHPGPINYGVEFAPEVIADKRSHVLKQVENGVLIRAAVLSTAFDREFKVERDV